MVSHSRHWKLSAAVIAIALAVAAAFTAGGVVPAASQTATLLAWQTEASSDLYQPWSSRWNDISPRVVPLSAQNATKPFGGGEVATIKARALHDGQRLFVMLEWKDGTEDDTVDGHTVFADAAAVELPAVPGVAVPSFCMGDATASVNIWHWKAAWQRDIDSGFTSASTRYPDGYSDGYPLPSDGIYQPARSLGNTVAQTTHATPVENLVAAAFGTLTTADVQDIDGKGIHRDGRWRVVFSRPLAAGQGYPSLAAGQSTDIAFAVWDGSLGHRDGIKSVSQFMTLQIGTGAAPAAGGGFPWWAWLVVGGVALAFTAGMLWAFNGPMDRRA